MAACAVAATAAVGQYAVPAVVQVLQRDPERLADGQWWRLLSPLLVQTLGWYQVLVNLVTLLMVGLVAERLLGRWRWVVLLVSGTAGGQVAAYAWQLPGGGSSIAVCGLAGGAVVALLAGRVPVPRLAARLTCLYVAGLTGWGFGGFLLAGLSCVAAASLLFELIRIEVPEPDWIALAGTVPCALVLLAMQDLHGASLSAGMAAMAMMLVRRGLNDRSRFGHRTAPASGCAAQ